MTLASPTAPIDLVFAANRGYLPYLSAALVSVRHSAPPAQAFRVTVLSRDLDSADIRWPNRGRLDELRCFAPVIPAESALPVRPGDHLTVETYYRLFMETAFGSEVQRVLYLDADLVAVADVSPLASLDLGGRAIGAVRDFHVRSWSGSSPPLPGDGRSGNRRYFNAGVLAIDLPAWRCLGVRERALRFLAEHQDTLRCWDQDALNFVLADNWLELDPRWNRMSHYWERIRANPLPFEPEVIRQLRDPFIVHFASLVKPWSSFRHPDRPLFDRFVTMAGYGDRRMTFSKAAWRAVRARAATIVGRSPVPGR